jgi:HK97 family phage portal protein
VDNPFKRLFKRDTSEAPNTTGGDTYGVTLGDNGTVSDVLLTAVINGEPITREQALSIPSVAANVDFISNCIAAMPVKLFKRKDGHVEEVTDDIRTRLLNNDTGDTLDAFQMKKALVTDYLLGKGGYCYIARNKNDVTGLYYVQDWYVTFNYDFVPIYKTYKIYVGENTYQPYEFIKILRNTVTGAWGVGIIEELTKALETSYETMKYQLGLVKTGGNKRGFLKSENKLTEAAMQELKAAWRRLYANNTENVVVLNKGLDFKEASNTSVEMQLNESIDSLNKEIDKIFHIYENFNETFKFAIYPIVKAFETALNRDLLLEKEKSKYFFEFDVKEIIKADIKSRYEVYRMSKECQMTTINERRRMENMNDIEGGDVIDLGLGAVLFDVNTQTYYTPNTNATSSGGSGNSGADVKTLEEESFIDKINDTEGNV